MLEVPRCVQAINNLSSGALRTSSSVGGTAVAPVQVLSGTQESGSALRSSIRRSILRSETNASRRS